MRITTLLVMAAVCVAGCGGSEPADPSKTPDGKLCARAYSSTVDSFTDLFTQSGAPMPDPWPSKDTYVEKCVASGFSEAQLKCLDPKIAGSDPEGCNEALKPVKDKQKTLNEWFTGEIKKVTGDKKAEKGEGEGDAAEEE